MAINPQSQYPGKINPGDANYPYGSARNVTVPGDGTGTPWEAALVNDLLGFQQAILSRASIVPTGSPEKVGASQYLDGLLSIIGTRGYATVAAMVADQSLKVGNRVLTFDGGLFETWTIAGSGTVLLANGLYATRTKRRIYTTLNALKTDATLAEGQTAFTFFSGDEKAKNGRQLYRIMDLSVTNTGGTFVDDEQIIALNNGLYAVAVQTTSDGNLPFSLSRVNMHFKALKGIPWNASEAGGTSTYTTAATASVGALVLSLTSSAGLVPDQLICYRADNGQYYSTVIESIASNVLTLRTPIEAQITAGGNVHNFYINFSHANPFGFYAITDYALRELTHTYRKVAEVALDQWEVIAGGETFVITNDEDIYAPGSTNNPYLRVTTTGVLNQGVRTAGEFHLPQGMYMVRAVINPGSTNGGADPHTIRMTVGQRIIGGVVENNAGQAEIQGQDTSRLFEAVFYAGENNDQAIRIQTQTAVAGEFEVGKVEIFKVENLLTNLDNSIHVMFGDSWFDFGNIQDRITDRFPNAVIFEEGVGGNTAGQLLARFDTNVTPHKPDYVWVMCGTNDYFQDFGLNVFDRDMNAIKRRIAEIGAIAIFFDPSVGEIDNIAEPQNFDRSRTYALQGSYTQAGPMYRMENAPRLEVMKFFIDQSIPATTTSLVLFPPGTTSKGYNIVRSFFSSGAVNVKAGYRATIGIPNEDVQTYAANTLVQPVSPVVIPPPSAGTRFTSIAIENPTGAPIVVTGYVEIEYYPNR